MDVFSLENDDFNGMFITQSDPDVSDNGNKSQISTSGSSTSGSMLSLLTENSSDFPVYEDISDDDFEIPPSQIFQRQDR